jgi:pyridoxine/pyridoxamine 5'-phosphate oxidase
MRTVVLRSCLARERMISCHTDRRSAKFRDLAADPRVALLFYDTQTREQLRCEATAHCHQDDEVAADAWATLAAASRAPYAQRLAPGSGLQHAIDNGNTAHQEPLCDELAQQQFVVIRCTVHRMDWLQLNPGGHERALMLWHGSAWHSERTAP